MKKIYTIIMVLAGGVANAQLSATNAASSGTSEPAACLSCPGAEWQNLNTISAADNNAMDVQLEPHGMCWQSICHRSRVLEASNFGFSIPVGAIDSIHVTVLRRAGNASAVRDSTIQLIVGGSIVGNNLASSSHWPVQFTNTVYGQQQGLWGLTQSSLTYTDINSPMMGVALTVTNDIAGTQSAFVDMIQMTVYYSAFMGSYTAVSTPKMLNWRTEESSAYCDFHSSSPGECTAEIFDAVGNIVRSEKFQSAGTGLQTHEVSFGNLSNGIYFLRLQSSGETFTHKFSVIR